MITAKLAYGARAAGSSFGPNSTLIFEVELLSIESKETASTPQATADSSNVAAADN